MNLIRPKNKFDIVGIRVIHFMHFSAFDGPVKKLRSHYHI